MTSETNQNADAKIPDKAIRKIFNKMDADLGNRFYYCLLNHWEVDLIIDLVETYAKSSKPTSKHSKAFLDNLRTRLMRAEEKA